MHRHGGGEDDKVRKVPITKGSPGHAGKSPADARGGESPPEWEDFADEGAVETAAAKQADALKAELEKAKAEGAQLKDKYLRLAADTENFKKRMNRESAEREKYYNEAIIKDLLPVLDNLERAIEHAAGISGEEGPVNGEALIEGVSMVKKQLWDALAKHGVRRVESVGLPFDPEKQQAMMQVDTDEYEEGTVVEEFQKGYFLNDRILRPAMVNVARRPGKARE